MIQELRTKYNSSFTEKKYHAFIDDINTMLRYPADFRVSETPFFLSDDVKKSLMDACEEILAQLQSEAFVKHSENAVPDGLSVPNEESHPLFLQIDFAIAQENGNIIPKLIELQGFPSLYAFQYFLSGRIQKHYPLLESFTTHFGGISSDEYLSILGNALLNGRDPGEVVLLEIEPELQKTRIDFAATEALFGIEPVCLSKVIKEGQGLFFINKNGIKTQIKRIYNRVILDELIRKNFPAAFSFGDELDVEWAGHPNWFFKISKHSLPFLKGPYVPECHFLHEVAEFPPELDRFVLKPLYSFAGHGVLVDVTEDTLSSLQDKNNYILQEKVDYAPAIATPDGFAKVEIRMMFIHTDRPLLVNNLVRMSKGKMMGVDFNKNKTWVGSSCAFIR